MTTKSDKTAFDIDPQNDDNMFAYLQEPGKNFNAIVPGLNDQENEKDGNKNGNKNNNKDGNKGASKNGNKVVTKNGKKDENKDWNKNTPKSGNKTDQKWADQNGTKDGNKGNKLNDKNLAIEIFGINEESSEDNKRYNSKIFVV